MSRSFLALTTVALLCAGSSAATTPAVMRRPAEPAIVLTLQLTIDSTKVARVSVPDAGAARISSDAGDTVVLTPRLRREEVELTVGIQSRAVDSVGAPLPSGAYVLAVARPTRVVTRSMAFDVEWVETRSVSNSTVANGPCSECCITCDGLTYCACEVTTPCGRCCCPDTCGCRLGPAPTVDAQFVHKRS